MSPIISSILDTDLYKFTVLAVIFSRFSNVNAEYAFTCRNQNTIDLLKYVPEDELSAQINNLSKLQLTNSEYNYLQSQNWFSNAFLEFLSTFRLNPNRHLSIKKTNNSYSIRASGPWMYTMMYETFILSIINEIYSNFYVNKNSLDDQDKLTQKIELLTGYNKECHQNLINPPQIMEFGTRRRFSSSLEEYVIRQLKKHCSVNLIGTSNVHLSKILAIPACGSFGHEFFMAMQSLFPIEISQKQALKIWLEEHGGKWTTALTDTLTDNMFFRNINFGLLKVYDFRHDSGDPYEFGEKVIKIFENWGIDPKTKKIVFSDGLDIPKVIDLHKHFRGRINMSFGVGTSLSNDTGMIPVQGVFKMIECDGKPVCKISNDPGKESCCNPLYLEYVKMAIEKY